MKLIPQSHMGEFSEPLPFRLFFLVELYLGFFGEFCYIFVLEQISNGEINWENPAVEGKNPLILGWAKE